MAERRGDGLPLSMTFYDLLGYVAPAGMFFICVWVFETWARHLQSIAVPNPVLHLPLTTGSALIGGVVESPSWIQEAILGFAILLSLYVFGHVIASLSSMSIERTLVFKGYGFPYEVQLDLPAAVDSEGERWSTMSRAFYRALFFWLNAYLIARYLSASLPTQPSFGSLRLGPVVANTIGILWFVLIVGKVYLGRAHSKAVHQLPEAAHDVRNTWWGGHIEKMIVWLAKPYDMIAATIASFMGTRRVFDEDFRRVYCDAFRKEFGLDPRRAGTNNFWFCYVHALESTKNLWGRIANWQTLYGFARNLSTAFFGAFLYGLGWFVVHEDQLRGRVSVDLWILFSLPVVYYLLSCNLVVRYYYLYNRYFTKFVFRAFVYASMRPSLPSDEARDDGFSRVAF